jgi:hypothetical protein
MGGEIVMPRVFTVLLLTFAIGSVRLLTAEEPVSEQLPVTVQIHDYWHVSNQSLAHARDFVTATYKQIGVRTEWLGVVQQNERHPGSAPRGTTARVPLPIAQITVIILTPSMAARGHVEEGALGFAAVPEEGMGRIAYAIYDRVRDTAARAAMNEDDLLGFVMAHEIAHLLLPRGAHTEAGLMRGHWNVQDLQRTDVLKLGFSPQQVSEMRSTLLHNTPIRSADALAAESRSVDACTAAGCELPVRQIGR